MTTLFSLLLAIFFTNLSYFNVFQWLYKIRILVFPSFLARQIDEVAYFLRFEFNVTKSCYESTHAY